ncbi:hypothetical protein GCM10023065_27830 [Microbacterium laevaniformans]|uniref:hypothetical protein n=1 Tax=Microbacterium laevaniformans TaxID=36807 RepID=UPI001959F768|nr:hypothetical protein [Microbacterium laevaniformans]MBM7753745.1 hypothetical protein [Microbacterium laevaniformans]GLJ64300.1 hypothetical protein GCM10017578_11880 [Microbacterium laevaniformans]
MSLQRQVEWEARFGDGLFVATILWIVFGALPMIGLLVGQLVTGGFVKSGDVPASFPAFMPPWWAAYPMTLLLVVLALGSLPLPLRGPRATTRGTLLAVLVLTFGTTLYIAAAAAAAEAHQGRVNFFGVDTLVFIQFVLIIITVARMLLGALRLLPRRWREYIDEDGTVVPPKEIVRRAPRRPWDWNRNRARRRPPGQ